MCRLSWIGFARMPGNCRDRKFRTYTAHSIASAIQAREPGAAGCASDGSPACPCGPIGDADVFISILACPASENLKQARRTHAAAHAHGHNDVSDSPSASLDQRMRCQAVTRHAIRMADGNGAAVDIEAVIGNSEPVAAIDHLHRKGFVQLPEPDIG